MYFIEVSLQIGLRHFCSAFARNTYSIKLCSAFAADDIKTKRLDRRELNPQTTGYLYAYLPIHDGACASTNFATVQFKVSNQRTGPLVCGPAVSRIIS